MMIVPDVSGTQAQYKRLVRQQNAKADGLAHLLPTLAIRKNLPLADAAEQLFAVHGAEREASAMIAEAKANSKAAFNKLAAQADADAELCRSIRKLAEWTITGEGFPQGNLPADLTSAAMVLRNEVVSADKAASSAAKNAAMSLSRAAMAGQEALQSVSEHSTKARHAVNLGVEKSRLAWLERNAETTADRAQADRLKSEAARLSRQVKALTVAYRARYYQGAAK